jgi:hypothetical protein
VPLPQVAKSEWLDHIEGSIIDPDRFIDVKARSQAMDRYTSTLAMRLQLAGVDAYRPESDHVYTVTSDGYYSILASSQYRHIIFLPSVQQFEIRQFARELEYCLLNKKWARMWVITAGPRCYHCDLQGQVQKLNKKIADLNKLLQKYGIETISSRIEFTLVRDEMGDITYHPHSHVIINPLHRIAPDVWATMLIEAHKLLPDYFSVCGVIRNLKEVTKYITKIITSEEGDGIGIMDLEPSELKQFQEAVFNQRLVAKYNSFRDQSRDFAKKECVLKKSCRNKKVAWLLVKKNKIKKKVASELTPGNDKLKIKNKVIGETICMIQNILQKGYLIQNFDFNSPIYPYGQSPINVHTNTITLIPRVKKSESTLDLNLENISQRPDLEHMVLQT